MPAEQRTAAGPVPGRRGPAPAGQAVREGVMMRADSRWAVAVRAPDGGIAVETFPLVSLTQRHPSLRAPVVRGVVALAEALRLGAAAQAIAAAAAGRRGRSTTMGLALILGAALLLVVPALLTRSTLLEGALRLAMFLGGLALASGLPGLRRAFAYHGAEHKAVACLEAGLPLTPDNARRCSRLHPRCGTGFVLVVVVVAGLVYLPLALSPWYVLVASRLLLFPLVVGLSFELVRTPALAAPGLQLQRLTTREPDAGQLAVAVAALEAVLPAEDRVQLKAVA